MTHLRHTWFGFGLRAPLGIVGPGVTPSLDPTNGRPGRGSGGEPRRFIVPAGRRLDDGARTPELIEFRRLLRDGGLVVGSDRTAMFIFGNGDEPTRQVVTFHLEGRRFEEGESHPPRLRREVLSLLESVSRVEVVDLREQTPPPGAMRDYLESAGVRGLLTVPLRLAGPATGEVIAGFLSFEVTGGPRSWSAADRTRAQEVARRIGHLLVPEIVEALRRRGPGASPGAAAQSVAPDSDDGVPAPAQFGRGEPTGRLVDRVAVAPPPPPVSLAAGREVGSPSPGRAHAPRRMLRTRLQTLRPFEAAGIIGSEFAGNLRLLLEVQAGILDLVGMASVDAGPADPSLLGDLRELSRKAREAVDASGVPGLGGGPLAKRKELELGRIISEGIPALADLLGPGSGVRLLLSPSIEEVRVQLDPALLTRALEHLVRNAGEALAGTGRVRISWHRARIEADPTREEEAPVQREVARIEIDDDGAGISRETLPWVFEPGFSSGVGGEGRNRRGLGLPFVQAVCELHGGWVDLHSDPGRGTRVSLNLPLAPGDRMTERPEEGPAPLFLLADEPVVARYITRILGETSRPVITTATVGELERRIGGAGVRPALLIVARSSFRFETLLKEASSLVDLLDAGLPILRVTPSAGSEEEQSGSIPVEPAALLSAVRNALDAGARSEEGGPGSSGATDRQPAGVRQDAPVPGGDLAH